MNSLRIKGLWLLTINRPYWFTLTSDPSPECRGIRLDHPHDSQKVAYATATAKMWPCHLFGTGHILRTDLFVKLLGCQ
jgi:hypothetical protein